MKLIQALLVGSGILLASRAHSQTLLFSQLGDAAGDYAGSSVAIVGDVDADGTADYAVGAWGNDFAGNWAGMVRVYSGSSQQTLYTWYGDGPNDRLRSVAGAGDLNGDGHADVLIGAVGGDYVDVMSGATGTALYRLTGATGFFGLALAGGEDINGDGVPDILVGAPFAGVGGEAFVFSGASGNLIRSHAGTCSGYMGHAVTFYGDVDGDGRSEYAVGRPLPNFGCGFPEVSAYDGATGTLLWTDAALDTTDELGWALEPLGDVTGDGIGELLAGAPQDPGVGCGPCDGKGFTRLLDGATGSVVWQVDGTASFSGLGSGLAAIGDLNGNGTEDFAVSQPSSEGCNLNTQAVQVREGSTGALLLEIPRPAAGDGFGESMDSGDANGDGLRDLLIGTPCDDGAGLDAGALHTFTVIDGVTSYCWPKTNSQECTPTIFATGTPSISEGTFRVKAQDVLNANFGLMFWSRVPETSAFQGGFLCVASPQIRTEVQFSEGNPPPEDCSGSYSFHFSGVYMQANGILPGDQIYCQYWSRDPQSSSGTGLTGGLAFRVLP